jgi:hypothetical protein
MFKPVPNTYWGTFGQRRWVAQRRVLLLVDNVQTREELELLLPPCGRGSATIVTSQKPWPGLHVWPSR